MNSGIYIFQAAYLYSALKELKPNNDQSDVGFRTWGESFADQTEMWTSLRDPGRVRAVLADTNGDLSGSNALSRIGEAFGALTGGTSLRDAVNDFTVSTTLTVRWARVIADDVRHAMDDAVVAQTAPFDVAES